MIYLDMADEINMCRIVLFHTSSARLRAEKIPIKGGPPVQLFPTPREFSSDCGAALRFFRGDESQLRALQDSANMKIQSIHKMQ
jgi:hypothetical protein